MNDLDNVLEKIKADTVERLIEIENLKATLHDCVNELCYQCGKYHESYAGACDGCRWKVVKEGFR